MPKVKGIYPGSYLWEYLPFTNQVISTHFGPNFLKISCDFVHLGVGRT